MGEADKSREIIVREMNNMKDLENDKIKDLEKKKNSEIKMLEKLNESLKMDKKDLEMRIMEMREKVEGVKSKFTTEYH